MTKMQGTPRTTARLGQRAGRGLPCILVIGEADHAVELKASRANLGTDTQLEIPDTQLTNHALD